jgi:hypothetical protein
LNQTFRNWTLVSHNRKQHGCYNRYSFPAPVKKMDIADCADAADSAGAERDGKRCETGFWQLCAVTQS